MLRGLYTAYTGMSAQMNKMDTISNNLANADTVGYKKDQVIFSSFKDVLTYKINDPESPIDQSIGKMSLGVNVDEIYTDHTQGAVKQTDETLNVALQGKGMMKIGVLGEDGTMTVKYTRDGSFSVNQKGELVTTDGLYVLGEENSIINVGSPEIRINADGSIYAGEEKKGQLQLVAFEDLKELRKQGGSQYITTENAVEKPFEGTVNQGFLESSNTSSVEEMINMINVMRTYEANQKIIQTYDSTMEKLVNNVGAV